MIHIKQKIVDQIIIHARRVNPIEACGYLAGNDDAISQIYEMRNADTTLAVDGISTRILGQTAFTRFRGGRLRLARREPCRNAMTSTPLPSAPTLRWLVAAAMLALVAHELHEIVHT